MPGIFRIDKNSKSERFPPTIIAVALQPSRNRARHHMMQPYFSVKLIIPLLIQKELMVTSKRCVRLAMFVEVRRVRPRAIITIQHENHAFADVDEETNCTATSG
jgi:hypothetical protein